MGEQALRALVPSLTQMCAINKVCAITHGGDEVGYAAQISLRQHLIPRGGLNRELGNKDKELTFHLN